MGRKFPETRSLATLVGSVWESCNLARRAGHERAKPVGNVLFLHFRAENGFLAVGDPEKSSGRATTNHDNPTNSPTTTHDKPRQPHDNPTTTPDKPRQPHDNPRQTTTTPRLPHDIPQQEATKSRRGARTTQKKQKNRQKA